MQGERSSDEEDKSILVEVTDYDEEGCLEFFVENNRMNEIRNLAGIPEGFIRWINIDAQIDQEVLEAINKQFHIHHLITEDIRNNKKRAKIESYDNYLYIVAKMIYYSRDKLIVEHMNFIMGKNYVISFGEVKGDVFDDLRARIRKKGTRIRSNGADYLIYSILDTMIDGYFEVLDSVSERIDNIEENIIEKDSKEWFEEIRQVKNTLLQINRFFWPLRDVLSRMGKDSHELIAPSTEPYIREIHEHIIQVIETTEMNRELLSGLTEVYISNTSNRLNEIMKVLTIISTIFIPLTFIAGVYGMNFKYMPELDYKWSYLIVWIVIALISIFMIILFKKKKWF